MNLKSLCRNSNLKCQNDNVNPNVPIETNRQSSDDEGGVDLDEEIKNQDDDNYNEFIKRMHKEKKPIK